jgi:hypothetical protein
VITERQKQVSIVRSAYILSGNTKDNQNPDLLIVMPSIVILEIVGCMVDAKMRKCVYEEIRYI